jgi:hypothetical protein
MVYNLVNGKLIIAKMNDEFNIKSRDWENRAPKWIADAMSFLSIYPSWERRVEEIKFQNYYFELPCSMKVLEGIIIDDIKQDKSQTIALEYLLGRVNAGKKFYTISGGKVITQNKEGVAYVIYKSPPVVWDDTTGVWIPKIPDIAEVQENIAWYVLKHILARGYVHPIYDLKSNSGHLNPHMLWEMTKKRARNRAKAMDLEDRRALADVMCSFLANPKADLNEFLIEDMNFKNLALEPVHSDVNYLTR